LCCVSAVVSFTRNVSSAGRGTGVFLFRPGEAGAERKYTNYCLYVTQINSTVDYMNLITVFLPSTGDACSSAVVSVISEFTIYASVGVSKNSMNKACIQVLVPNTT
jgi:hypothetical protein